MAIAAVKKYNGTQELTGERPMDRKQFAARFPGVIGKNYDGYSKWVGYVPGATIDGQELPVTRIIEYKRYPSKHKCDARCQDAKGHTCECSCGGQFHGAGA